jgi:hypothetical protein
MTELGTHVMEPEPMNDVVVEVRGGIVVEIYSDAPDLRLSLVDWDNIRDGDHPFCWGNPAPMSDMPEDTRASFDEAVRHEDTEQTALGGP